MLTLTTRPAAKLSRPTTAPRSVLLSALKAFRLQRSRRALAQLSAEQLADVGLTREQAEAEAKRPLWDAPAHWRG